MNKNQKTMLWRIATGVGLLSFAIFLNTANWINIVLYVAAYIVLGYDVLIKAATNIFKGKMLDENFLMVVATVGAFCIGEYPEAVLVILLYKIGEWFEKYAVGKSRNSIAELMDIRPDYANIEKDGQLVTVMPEQVAVGDIICVKAGEKIPIDGVVVEGEGLVDTSALTGESVPRNIAPNDIALSGCINLNGYLKIKTSKEFGQSTVSKILDLVENASTQKAKSENFITRFSRIYTPCVVLAAILLAVVPPIFFGQPFTDWLNRGLIFLVVSCPCALVISVPLSFFGGIGGASRQGILIKGSNYLEVLAKAETVVFDKTGTLTKGNFEVCKINAIGIGQQKLIELAAMAENYSNHPISISIKKEYGKQIDTQKIGATEQISGMGVRTIVEGKTVFAGNAKLMEKQNIVCDNPLENGTIVHIATDNVYNGYIVISDTIKEDAQDAIKALKKCGVKQCIMLTGDADSVAQNVAAKIGIDKAYSQLLPADKVAHLQQLLKDKKTGTVCFVGDGINDAPVLALADVGVAMGALGSDAAIESADIVLMQDKPSSLASAIAISRKTVGIARQNIVFALAIKAIVLILSAFGFANMWLAIFADVGVSSLAILNAMRALSNKEAKKL